MTHGSSLKSLTDDISRFDVLRLWLDESLFRARTVTNYYNQVCDELEIPTGERPMLEAFQECEESLRKALEKVDQAYAGYSSIEDVRTDRE